MAFHGRLVFAQASRAAPLVQQYNVTLEHPQLAPENTITYVSERSWAPHLRAPPLFIASVIRAMGMLSITGTHHADSDENKLPEASDWQR